MDMQDADDLVLFQDVRVIRSTPPALLCQIGTKTVWLPRAHISGKLWCAGDRGKLFIRSWVVRDQNLPDPRTSAIGAQATQPRSRTTGLHLVR